MYYMLWSAKFCFMKWMMCGVVSIFVEPYNRFFGSILLPEKPNLGDPLPPKKISRIWLSGNLRLYGRGGVGFAPRPRHFKDVKNSSYCCSVQR